MQVNPDKFDLVNGPGGKAFADFMVSEKAQQMIGDFGDEKYGKPLFIAGCRQDLRRDRDGDAFRIDSPDGR